MGAFTFNAISGVRAEVVVLRTDVAELRTEVRSDVADLRADVADLRERMARLEGLFEGFTGRAGESGARHTAFQVLIRSRVRFESGQATTIEL